MPPAAFSIPTPLWPADIDEARRIQQELSHQVRLVDGKEPLDLIAGIDCSFGDEGRISYAFAVLMRMGDFHPLHTASAALPTAFSYVPGFLSFREIPVILKALDQLPQRPDLLMVDGQGVAHPRRLGIAAHLGVLLDIPAIGVAKSRLCGSYDMLGDAPGSASALLHNEEMVGYAFRSKKSCNPLFISAGHRITHEAALDLTRRCFKGYRLPEPTRIADKISKTEKPVTPLAIDLEDDSRMV